MKLKALSHYDNDMDTRFGDCILLYDNENLIVYDCGHQKHSETIQAFLQANSSVSKIHIVISHNDRDHTNGVIDLLDYLHTYQYNTTVYSSLYLKSAKKVTALLDDKRRTTPATKKHILETFDKIAQIVNKASEYSFGNVNAVANTDVASAKIVGPTEDEFVEVVAQAIKTSTDSKIEGETVMNAASVQLKVKLDDHKSVLLCGDASPSYLHNLDDFNIIQLPHHGQLESAKRIFESLDDPYSKMFLISDNTGSAENSGGSFKLKKYLQKEHYKATMVLNTQTGVIDLPDNTLSDLSRDQLQRRACYGDLGSV